MSSAEKSAPSNFLRTQIESDLARATELRPWSGKPGPAAQQRGAPPDPARIRTRFPPEPNGYLHIGHAKSICLNFGLARDYKGRCHLRFDDTNPVKEDQAYVDSIIDTVRWLGFNWQDEAEDNLYYASDYFEYFYQFAEALVQAGHAYVDEQSADEMRQRRGTLTEAGTDSPWRNRPAGESLQRLREMRAGTHPEGSMVLRARIDMASPNLNMRDPSIYRIRHAHHHRTGDHWPIYPMYDYAHPISDALEGITHSICTLEFEDHRPFYDWLLARLAELGLLDAPLPRQFEFARLNLSYVVTSKRKLQQLVEEGHVSGWDDPRLPTLAGLRRRGYTPESLQLFCERIGVSKADSWIDFAVLEQALRDTLDPVAPRAVAVIHPLRLVLDNLPADHVERCVAPVHPQHPEHGERVFTLTRELWIEADDFQETPVKGFFRLSPGARVRLRYGHVIECTGFERNDDGSVSTVHANVLPDSKSGTPGANNYKVKGNIHWLSVDDCQAARFHLFDRLFTQAQPDAGGRDWHESLNPESCRSVQGWIENTSVTTTPGVRFQFERNGYFVADQPEQGEPEANTFNRIATLKDTWMTKQDS